MTLPPNDLMEPNFKQMDPKEERAVSHEFAIATEVEIIRELWKSETKKSHTVYAISLLRLCRSYRRLCALIPLVIRLNANMTHDPELHLDDAENVYAILREIREVLDIPHR